MSALGTPIGARTPGPKDGDPTGSPTAALLDRTWSDPPGFTGWFSAINHKTIARRFMVTTMAFFVLAGLLAAVMRMQLAHPDNRLVGPDFYNQLFTMHGTTMMFLFAVPVMQAVGMYLVPLMVGSRTVAFPRMNAFGYWIFLFGGVMLWVAFALDIGPDAGWFAYPPLSGPDYSPGKRVDMWAQMITFTELSALVEAVALITTVFKLRAPGMTLNRIPLFVWSMLVVSFMILFAMPAVMLGSTALILDRLVGTHFYNPGENGDPLLWQHLFWFFGHPEVYLIFIPALGFMSTIIQVFSRRPVFGYTALVLSLIATAFLGFGLWVHHMFATNVPELGKSFFTAASMLIAIPTATQIFCWISTLATGRIHWRVPLWFILAFFFILIIGGLTGLMLAAVPLDLQVHDTYFVVAHLHYVLIGGAVFPLFGAFYFWWPKFTGRMLSEKLGMLQFWLFFIGFNVAFFPMHILGLQGMTRRIWTYQAHTGWGTLNFVSTVGAVIVALSVLAFLVNVVWTMKRGVKASANPWGADTLDWSVSSPPPPCNYHVIPVVHGRDPLWEPRHTHLNLSSYTHVTGLAADMREVLVTTALEAVPQRRELMPTPTPVPFFAAVAVTILFIGSIFTPWAVVWGAIPVAITLTMWFWPSRRETAKNRKLELAPDLSKEAS